MKRYQAMSSTLAAIKNCSRYGSETWMNKHEIRLDDLMRDAPSGGGIDRGTKIAGSSTSEKLVFELGFHHMNLDGYYTEWTEHTVIVKGSLLSGTDLRITGRDRNEIKDYLYEVYECWLEEEVE
jgi:hypothetical protein